MAIQEEKNALLCFILTMLFGPLGLLYVSVPWALFLIVFGIGIGLVTFLIGSFLMWPLSVLLSVPITLSYNTKVRRQNQEIQSLRNDVD